MSNNKLAIFLIIISVFFGTVMLSFLKIAQEDVNVYVAGFFRFFLGLVIILPYIIKKKDAVLKTPHLKKHLLRAILGLPAMLLYFSALSKSTVTCTTVSSVWQYGGRVDKAMPM